MNNKLKKAGYEAPKMETTSFKTENGYAASGTPPQPTIGVTLNVGRGGL